MVLPAGIDKSMVGSVVTRYGSNGNASMTGWTNFVAVSNAASRPLKNFYQTFNQSFLLVEVSAAPIRMPMSRINAPKAISIIL